MAAGLLYAVVALSVILEKAGQRTNDTRIELVESPVRFLRDSLSLWNHDVSLGELQNQAYGYLFPQGPWFAAGELAGLPAWVTQRLWSTVLVLAACEGARRLARAMGVSPWGSLAAGAAYALAPRVISEVGVRSGELLPTVVAPWVLLPVVLCVLGRLTPARAALLSAAAYSFSGGVNGTATAAPLPLTAIVVVWAVSTRRAPRALLGWWLGLIGICSLWWLTSLLQLNRFAPPFFDYVEDAPTTTLFSGATEAVRGQDNWVSYITVADRAWWPAGYSLAFEPWLILVTGVVGTAGLVGLLLGPRNFRAPLVASAAVGFVFLTVGHLATGGSPLAPAVQSLLDGAFAPLRNVHKIDPVLRLPLSIGVGALVDSLLVRRLVRRVRRPARRMVTLATVAVLGLSVVAMGQPLFARDLRTPGWKAIPDYWHQTAALLASEADPGRAWVIPGTGFGIQEWGWTMEEPFEALARTPWLTRNQVPLAPPETIRMLDRLESALDTGAGSPYLGTMLSRLGVDRVVVRHDLDNAIAESTSSDLVSIALARSAGIERVAAFGALDFGPAIEVFEVTTPRQPLIQVRDLSDVVTVASDAGDVLTAVGEGLVAADQPTIVRGEPGWSAPADVVGDSVRRVERNFGRVHEAVSGVMTPADPYRLRRLAHDYGLSVRSDPVSARLSGVRSVRASSSSGYADVLGPVRPENAPYAAVDEDLDTSWRSDPLGEPIGQWVEVGLPSAQRVYDVTVRTPIGVEALREVASWTVLAGGRRVRATVNPFTGQATAALGGVRTTAVRVMASSLTMPGGRGPVGVSELQISGVAADRTLVVPPVATAPDADFVFTARPETRACISTLLGPDCDIDRARPSEESAGIDRLITTGQAGVWTVDGVTVARSRAGTAQLLDPLGGVRMAGSSWLSNDPGVSPRMAYDGDDTTSWIADPHDRQPVLTVDLPRAETFTRIGVSRPGGGALAPAATVIRSGSQTRSVDLHGFGFFEPLRARRLTLTFEGPPGATRPLGVGDVYLSPGNASQPLRGGDRSGSVCGLGPVLLVDGQSYPTRVDGFLGDIASAGPLGFAPCGRPVRIGAGTHRVQVLSTEQFQPVTARFVRGALTPTGTPSRTLSVDSFDDDHQVVEVGPGLDAALSTGWNFNNGWVASVEGRQLVPVRIDGWSQGWVVPEGVAGKVDIRFAPQRQYIVRLVIGLALVGIVLLAALLVLASLLWRRPRSEAAEVMPLPVNAEAPPSTRTGGSRHLLVWGAAALVAGGLGGVAMAAGVVAGTAAARARRGPLGSLLISLGVIAVMAGLIAAALAVWSGPALTPASAHLAAAFGTALLLAAAWSRASNQP